MIFSYYFNPEKTNRINCGITTSQLLEDAFGNVTLSFEAYIEEFQNDVRLRRESIRSTFNLMKAGEKEAINDLELSRVRHGGSKKWIFTITNNRNNAQRVQVGLYSETARKNPLGCEILHEELGYDVELRANTLSILSQNYTPPLVKQTVDVHNFDNTGLPLGFESNYAVYDSLYKNYKLSQFKKTLKESLPAATAFTIEMDVAPMEVETKPNLPIFTLDMPNIGVVNLYRSGYDYLLKDGMVSDLKRVYLVDNLKLTDFWENNRFKNHARLVIKGDGKGEISIAYLGKVLKGRYDHTATLPVIEFNGTPSVRFEGDDENPAKWITSRLDNFSVFYEK